MILDQLRVESVDQPVFIFMGKADPLFEKEVEDVARDNLVTFELIREENDAMLCREQYRDAVKGIFIIDRAYCRGYDLKCARDSLVFVYDNKRDYRTQEAKQSFGRSSRSQ